MGKIGNEKKKTQEVMIEESSLGEKERKRKDEKFFLRMNALSFGKGEGSEVMMVVMMMMIMMIG